MPLPWAYLTLFFLTDLALVAVTMLTALRVVGTGRAGAMVAAALTMTVSAIHLGDATELRYAVFQPACLGIPGMLLALALGWRGRPVWAAVVSVAAIAVSVGYGVYGAGLGLASAFAALLADRWNDGPARALRFAFLPTLAGAALFATSLMVFWWWPSRATQPDPLSTAELFAIIAAFRSPHHYLPSAFRPQDLVTLAFFMWATWLAYDTWRRSTALSHAGLILLPIALVTIGCVVGTVFMEIWPVRSVLTLQTFRLLSVLKWIGFLLFGFVFADHWHHPTGPIDRPAVGMSLLSAGGAQALVTAAGLSLLRVGAERLRGIPPLVPMALLPSLGVIASLLVSSWNERVRLFAAVLLLAAFATGRRRRVHVVCSAAVVAAVVGIAANRPTEGRAGESPFRPIFSFEDHQDVDARTARLAAEQSPTDAVFVVPPGFGLLRLIGRRALVVDFEAIPLQDAQMRAWRERVRDVYGETDRGGHAARAALDEQYRRVTDDHLRALAQRYGATHAVLYAETPTALPVVLTNERYRVVRLASGR